jgi:hypothetical protein
VGCSCPPRAKRLFTSTFTAQTPGFQSHDYRRVGGSAAVASGDDVDVFDRFRAAGSGCPFRPIYHDAEGKKILRIRDGIWKLSSIRWARKAHS